MDKKETARQTLTGLIRSRMATYQARQLAGVTQKTFAQELTDEGHPISYADFRTLFSRARKQLAAQAQPSTEPRKEPINEKKLTKKQDKTTKKVPDNPLTKSTGFEYEGTLGFDENDLI